MSRPSAAESQNATTPDAILHLGFAFWGSKTLLSAIGLGLFTELGDKHLSLDDIAARLKLHPRSSRDFLDALVAMHMLERENGLYANTAATAQFLDRHKPHYVGGILEMAEKRLYGFWGHLTEALHTGQSQNESKSGIDPFADIYRDTENLRTFLHAMTGISIGAAVAIAEKFDWGKYKTFVDVGCAQGALPVIVAKAWPALRGTGADLPAVQPIFEDYVKAQGVAERLSFKSLDFFTEPLPQADVIVMGHILHDWNLEQKKMIIKKAYEALPAGGSFIVYEALIDDDRRRNTFGLLMSLNMLIETPGGFDYTGADCMGWMKEAGFKDCRVEHLVGPDSMVIGVK